MRQRWIRTGFLAFAISCGLLAAQEPGQQGDGRGGFGGMQRVTGTVTAVAGPSVTVKAEDGTVYTVTTTPNTRVMKGQGALAAGGGSGAQPLTIKVADLKPGDGVMAAGNMDAPNKTLHAAFVVATDAEQVKKLRENLGKTYIAGKVTAIDGDNLKMTVQRADGVAQTIGFDESTSFKRGGRGMRGGGGGIGAGAGAPGANPPPAGGESITLADIKVGDNVGGTGALKSGVFVPGTLIVTAPRPPRADRTPGQTPPPKPE